MDLRLTPEQRDLVDAVNAALDRYAPLDRIDRVVALPGGYDKALAELAVELGWTGLGLESPGDPDGTLVELGLVLAGLGRHAVASPLRTAAAAGVLVARATPTAAGRALLDRIAGGTPAAVLDVGGDPAAVLDRTLPLVDWAPTAAEFVLITAVDGGFVLRGLPAGGEQLRIDPVEVFDNESVADVTVSGLSVADLPELGRLDADGLADWRALERLLRVADLLGAAERATSMAVDNAKVRHQFGVPIGSFQALQHHAANMRMDIEGIRALLFAALWRAANGFDFRRHALMAAVHAGDAAERITRTAVQIHGGIGFIKEYPLHHFYRRAKAHKLRLGTPRVLHRELGRQVVADARSDFEGHFVAWPVVPAGAPDQA